MAGGKPYGGPHSPGRNVSDTLKAAPVQAPYGTAVPPGSKGPAPAVFDAKARRRVRGRKRSMWLFAFAVPLLFAALIDLVTADVIGAMMHLAIFIAAIFGIWTIREGLEAETEYERRAFAAPPKVPRKIVGSGILGAAIGAIGLFSWDIGVVSSLLLAVLTGAAALGAFGLDPLSHKGERSIAGVDHAILAKAIEEAEEKIAGIEACARNLRDRSLGDTLFRIAGSSRQVLERLERDPDDLRRARKFLRVYLDGVLDASRKYVAAQDQVDPEMEWKYRSLLRDMEETARQKHQRLVDDEHATLDVEIEVLADRLKQEAGIAR